MIFNRLAAPLFAAIALGTVGSASASDDWSTLPWDELLDHLSSPDILMLSDKEEQAAAYNEECYTEFKKERDKRLAQNLSAQQSGLCMNQLACAFENCNPIDPTDLTVDDRLEQLVGGIKGPYNGDDLPNDQAQWDGWLAEDNPAWNLPSVVLFPVTAGDVVAAIKFAKEHQLEVSVKTSGNSYTGASTKKDTLHLNMNKRFTSYSQGSSNDYLTGIIECDSTDESASEFKTDLSDQPCRLAQSRGKHGVVRIGGGEQFGVSYASVNAFNKNYAATHGTFKYHLLGGAAGTVSPMGWTFQGGLGSTTAGRLYGIGVDQVIMIEMVLPSGKHVRFGPTKWEDPGEGYTTPKTLEVSGVCNQNPEEEDEGKWIWAACDEDINWFDLWFAMRGGGGGTWGVVTSLFIQLHEYEPLELVTASCGQEVEGFAEARNDFVIKFLLNPESVGVTEEESRKCGGFRSTNIFCYGEDSSKPLFTAWSAYVIQENKEELASCFNPATDYDDYYSLALQLGEPYVWSFPYPSYLSTNEKKINLLVPAKYYVENPIKAAQDYPPSYLAFGGKVPEASDQANALSPAHRLAGNMAGTDIEKFDDHFFTEVFPQMFDTSDPENFPGFVGSNHAGPNTRGPLKSDWTKACPLDWTIEERNEKCISVQEAIWGTKLLRKLEKIKDEVDPHGMFNCIDCVGNNRDNRVKGGGSNTNCVQKAKMHCISACEEEGPCVGFPPGQVENGTPNKKCTRCINQCVKIECKEKPLQGSSCGDNTQPKACKKAGCTWFDKECVEPEVASLNDLQASDAIIQEKNSSNIAATKMSMLASGLVSLLYLMV